MLVETLGVTFAFSDDRGLWGPTCARRSLYGCPDSFIRMPPDLLAEVAKVVRGRLLTVDHAFLIVLLAIAAGLATVSHQL